MVEKDPGGLLNAYSKAANKTEFEITTAERSNPFAALYNGVKLYIHKDACCSCGGTSVPNVVFSWTTGTEGGVSYIAISIVDGDKYTAEQLVNIGYLVQDQSGNEVWTGFVFDPQNTSPAVLDTSTLVGSDEWTITFSVSGVKTDLGCTPKLTYSVTLPATGAESSEYFLNRNAAAWDARISDLAIDAAEDGENKFSFKFTALTSIPEGAVIPLLAYGIPGDIVYTGVDSGNVTIDGNSLVASTALAVGDIYTVEGNFDNATPVTGKLTLKIVDSIESNNTTSDTYE